MQPATLSNVLSYCAQIACVTAAAATLPALLRLRAPGVRYAYWRAVVLLCLILPWMQGRHTVNSSVPIAAATPVIASVTTTLASPAAISPKSLPFDWAATAAVVIGAGTILRLLWIAGGLLYLRRLRTAGYCAALDDDSDLQEMLGTRAQIRTIPGLKQPVTFGVIHPVVLLPDSLGEHPSEVRRAVLAHELFHVQRRDWAWILGEELIRAVFWFHPAIWWLISRVQLSREEVVDELSVLATGRRRTYAEALLVFADSTPLAPAPAFARRRHLLHRMVLISTEAVMSSKRIVASCAVMLCVVLAGSWSAVRAFPLSQSNGAVATPSGWVAGPQIWKPEPGPLEKRANPITPENPVPRRVMFADAAYPAEAAARQASGGITLLITLDELGRVAEARVQSVAVYISGLRLNFTGPANPRGVTGEAKVSPGVDRQTDAITVLEAFTKNATDAVRQWRYDPPANAPISFPVTFAFHSEPAAAMAANANDAQTSRVTGDDSSWMTDGALRVGGAIAPPKKLRHVPPVYPPIAMSAHVSGVVIIEARVEGDGRISRARVLKSIPLLDQAALDAVYQWEFTPTLMNGTPTPVIMTVTVNFESGTTGNLTSRTPSSLSDGAIRIGGELKPPTKLKHVPPVYPPAAQANRISGIVIIEARIESDGTVSRTHVLKSIPMLDEAAEEAVRQWVFTPTWLNGQPTPVVMTLTVNFTLE
jgi:TonB family protein